MVRSRARLELLFGSDKEWGPLAHSAVLCCTLWVLLFSGFTWAQSKGRVYLMVRMTDSFSSSDNKPFLELVYDGKTGELVNAKSQPANLNPCAG